MIMEEQINPLAMTHLIQHTLRSLCVLDNSQWVYAVFWRILPRNYPPPKWDIVQGAYDGSRGNKRNWILVWEDGFCNFAASTGEMTSGDCPSSSVHPNSELQQQKGLQPELFFKMSHEIYNYGEGLIGKVAADRSHKWIHNEANDQDTSFSSPWQSSADTHPRTWEAQFECGIKTIALIAVREGVVQLGAVSKVMEDLSYVVLLKKKFSYIESIPGVLLPHPSSAGIPCKFDGYSTAEAWSYHGQTIDSYDTFNQVLPIRITPSMSSLEALLSKLPSVVPPTHIPQYSALSYGGGSQSQQSYLLSQRARGLGLEKVAKLEEGEDDDNESGNHEEYDTKNVHEVGGGSTPMTGYLNSSDFLNTKI